MDIPTILDYTQSSIENQCILRKTSPNALHFQYQLSKKWKHQVEKQLINHSTFFYQNITFRKHNEEMYQTNSIDLFAALYHLTYENENDVNEILNIQDKETIEQVATFERIPSFNCKFNINK